MALPRTFRLPHTKPAGGHRWTTSQLTENFRAIQAQFDAETYRSPHILALTTSDTYASGIGTHTLASAAIRSEVVRTAGGIRVIAAGNTPWFDVTSRLILTYNSTEHTWYSATSACGGGPSVGWWLENIDLMNADGTTSAQWSQWGYKAGYGAQDCDEYSRNLPTTQEVTIAIKAEHSAVSDQSECNLLMVELLPSLI